jgi:hypothetical protein
VATEPSCIALERHFRLAQPAMKSVRLGDPRRQVILGVGRSAQLRRENVRARAENLDSRPAIYLCGRVESNRHSTRRRGYSLLSSPVLSVRRTTSAADRIRTGTARITTSDAAVTPQPPRNADGRTRTGRNRLTSEGSPSELRPPMNRMARVGFEPTVSSS